MRALLHAIVFMASLLFFAGSGSGAAAGPQYPVAAATRAAGMAEAVSATAPRLAAADIESPSRVEGRSDDASDEIGFGLIIAAIVLVVVIIGFIIRNHRRGGAG